MLRINEIKATGEQHFVVPIDTGDDIDITMHYLPAVKQWTIDVGYKAFRVNGLRIVKSFNLLYQYASIIPFGISIKSNDTVDPFLIQDFSSNRCEFYILTADELPIIDDFIVQKDSA